jgi:hypothetical protein
MAKQKSKAKIAPETADMAAIKMTAKASSKVKVKVKKKISVDSVQWLLPGDHELVIAFAVPGSHPSDVCPICSLAISGHGLLAGARICPGDYVVDDVDGKSKGYSPAEFAALFE